MRTCLHLHIIRTQTNMYILQQSFHIHSSYSQGTKTGTLVLAVTYIISYSQLISKITRRSVIGLRKGHAGCQWSLGVDIRLQVTICGHNSLQKGKKRENKVDKKERAERKTSVFSSSFSIFFPISRSPSTHIPTKRYYPQAAMATSVAVTSEQRVG